MGIISKWKTKIVQDALEKQLGLMNPLSMARSFMPIYGEPPRRSTQDWSKEYNNSPRMNPVHQIASDVGTSFYGVYRVGDTKKIKQTNTSVESILKTPNPNSAITEYVLLYITQVYLLLPSGEAFWIKERNGYGKVTELWPVPPDWVTQIPSQTDPYFTIFPQGNIQGRQIKVPEWDMIYFKKPDVLNPYLRGVGRAMGISDELETDSYMAKYAKRFFWNDAIPAMVGMMPGADEATIERQTEKWNQKYGGYNNPSKTAWLNWDAQIKVLKETNKEMDFVKSRQYLRDTSNQHFNIPPELFGILENSNRSTIDAAWYLYTKNVLRKELKFIDDVLNRQLIPEFAGNIYLEHDNVVPEDAAFELQKASEGLKNGGITVDEWRRANGWDELPDGKGRILYTPLNMMPTNLDGKPLMVPPEPPALDPEPPAKGVKKNLTPEAKQRVWHIFDKAALKYERSFISAMKKFFQDQQSKVNDALSKSIKAIDPDDVLDWQEEDGLLKAQMSPLWRQSLKEGFDMAESTYNFGVSFDVVNPKFVDWINENGLGRAKGINDTTRDRLQKTLSEGIMGGETIPKLRDRVGQIYENAKGYRATLIARTETTSTVNYGAMETYVAAGVKQKEWLATMDDRVREEHASLNGEVVAIDEPFSNGSMNPDDPNCRCTILPVIGGEEIQPGTQPPSGDYVEAETTGAAEQWARDNGLADNISYSGIEPDMANEINRTVSELLDEYPGMKNYLKSIESFAGEEMGAVATTTPDGKFLFNSRYFKNKEAFDEMLKTIPKDWTVNASASGVIRHEFGHAAYNLSTEMLAGGERSKVRIALGKLARQQKKEIATKLSKYGASQPSEAIAEMFVAKLDGRTFEGHLAKIDKLLTPLLDSLKVGA